jgi:hypothetical protein
MGKITKIYTILACRLLLPQPYRFVSLLDKRRLRENLLKITDVLVVYEVNTFL